MASSFLRRMDSQYLESWISFISSRPFYPFYYIINFILCDIFQNVSKVSSPFYGDSSLLQFDGRTHALWWGRICAGGVATRGNYVDPGWGGDQGTTVRWPGTGPSVTLLSLVRGAAVRRGWWPYCVTPPTPAPSHSATSAARPWTRYWYASPGPPHILPPEIIARYLRYIRI